MRMLIIPIAAAGTLVATPAAAQQVTIDVDGPNRDATIVKERIKTEDGVIKTTDISSGDYSSSRIYERTRTENGFSSTSSYSNSNGKTASGSTIAVRDGNRWTRDSQQVGPNGGVRSVDQTVMRTGNSGWKSKKTVTSPSGETRTVKRRTKRSR